KLLNDTHGHQVGDQLLIAAGKVIGANMRRMDVAARYGGDEFVLLLPHASAEDAAVVAQRIINDFAVAAQTTMRRPCAVTMSVGVSSIKKNHPSGADQLIALADAALYKAKQGGRNRIATSPAVPQRVPA